MSADLNLPLKANGLSISDANGVTLAGAEDAAVAQAIVAAVNDHETVAAENETHMTASTSGAIVGLYYDLIRELGVEPGGSLVEAIDALRRDAERWRAFYSTARFKMIGSANLDHSAYPKVSINPAKERGDWIHFGLEVWDRHPEPEDTQGIHGRNVLNAYVDHMVAERVAARGTVVKAAPSATEERLAKLDDALAASAARLQESRDENLAKQNRFARLYSTVADVAKRIAAQVKASDAYAASAATKTEARPTVWELQNGHFRDLGDELTKALEEGRR